MATTSEATSCARLCQPSCEGFSTLGNAVFTSQEHAARTEAAYLQSVGQHEWALYFPWSCSLFPPLQSTAYSLPPTRWAHVDSEKTGTRLVGWRRRLQKPSMDTRRKGCGAANQYISPEVSKLSRDCACSYWTQKPCDSFTGN